MIESLKAEIRINNQNKDKPQTKIELTEKIKRQIQEMIKNNIERALTQSGGGTAANPRLN